MSFYLIESSSDSKMDISDATNSLDSTGISPLAEDDETPHNNDNIVTQMIVLEGNFHENELTSKISPIRLDNRFHVKRPEMLSLESTTPQRLHIERTITASHPLMSPTGTDSEGSEKSHNHFNGQEESLLNHSKISIDIKCHNFPDVVPCSERLQATSIVTSVSERNTLNNMRIMGRNGMQSQKHVTNNKIAALRTGSPDLLSSESEADVSQYNATVEPNFQSVALTQNNAATNLINHKHTRCAKKNTKTTTGGCDDISSLDSISNHSFDDDDIEHNLASLSPSSSIIDGLNDVDDDDDDCEGPELHDEYDDDYIGTITPTSNKRNKTKVITLDTLPQYTAAQERRDSRNWQKITLPDGRTREIDMRVIEPYKRVLSHGGYLKSGGQNAIVIFCACHLPDRSRADYNYVMDNLFLYVVKTITQLVTEDYVLIYLHGGSSRRNVPPFPWIKKCYQLLDRRLRKSLKNMYLVHPTFWVKSIVWMTRPFVSAKFWRKLIYVKSLEELNVHVSVEKAAIPDKVKQYDAKHK